MNEVGWLVGEKEGREGRKKEEKKKRLVSATAMLFRRHDANQGGFD